MNPSMFDEQGLYDIFDHWHVPFWQTKLFFGCIIVLCLCLLFIGFFYCWMRKRQKSPAQIAIEKLTTLKKNNYKSYHAIYEGYYHLTAILKTYLQTYYQIPYQSMTDFQMNEQMNKQLPSEKAEYIKEIIEISSQVKYAQASGAQELFLHHIQLSIETIAHLEKNKTTHEK